MLTRVEEDVGTLEPRTRLVGGRNDAASLEDSLPGPHTVLNTKLLSNPAVLLGINPRELKIGPHKNLYTQMSVAVLFVVAKRWRPTCPSAGRWSSEAVAPHTGVSLGWRQE